MKGENLDSTVRGISHVNQAIRTEAHATGRDEFSARASFAAEGEAEFSVLVVNPNRAQRTVAKVKIAELVHVQADRLVSPESAGAAEDFHVALQMAIKVIEADGACVSIGQNQLIVIPAEGQSCRRLRAVRI